jgi:hypothetical protein
LASYIIEELQAVHSSHVLFFYCKNNDQERDSFISVARSLIQQTVLKDDIHLHYIYAESCAIGESPLKTIKQSQRLLEASLGNLDNIYIILDGIDECKPGEANKIISWFLSKTRSLQDEGKHVKCLFSSQDDEETNKLFKDIPTIRVGGEGLGQDIQTFCTIECKKLKDMYGLSDEKTKEIIETVTRKTDGKLFHSALYFIIPCEDGWLLIVC